MTQQPYPNQPTELPPVPTATPPGGYGFYAPPAPREPGWPPTATGLPRNDGSSRCSTDA